MHQLLKRTDEVSTRFRINLGLIAFGETGLETNLKSELEAISHAQLHTIDPHYIQPALKHLHATDPSWVSEWVLERIAANALYSPDTYFQFATNPPSNVVEFYLHKLESEETKLDNFSGVISILAAYSDIKLATLILSKLRDLENKLPISSKMQQKIIWNTKNKLQTLFQSFRDDIAVAAILSTVNTNDPLDIKVTTDIISRVARSDKSPLLIENHDLKKNLLSLLKGWVKIVLSLDDFNGEMKAHLASAISQAGTEDVSDLLLLIHADIKRVRRGRAARAAGDNGPLGNGATMSYASWHISALTSLDSADFEQILIDLISEPEYRSYAAAEMARRYIPKSGRFYERAFRYDLMWAARDGLLPSPVDQRRKKYATALNAEITRLQNLSREGKPASGIKELAKSLAAIDCQNHEKIVLDVIALHSEWSEYTSLEAAEHLLIAGSVLPAHIVFSLIDSILNRKWLQDSERRLLCNILAICPFVDDIEAGITKIREVIENKKLYKYELGEIITALGESRSDYAVAFVYELASDAETFKQCEENFVNAFIKLRSILSNEKLIGFIDPSIHSITLELHSPNLDKLAQRLSELAQTDPKLTAKFVDLCGFDLPPFNRQMLSKVMGKIGSPAATSAHLLLVDDNNASPIPLGLREQFENAFIERRPYESSSNTFTQHSRASNDLRTQLFQIATSEDSKRKNSCISLLGLIENLRLEHGRPIDEPRHPNLTSSKVWPIISSKA